MRKSTLAITLLLLAVHVMTAPSTRAQTGQPLDEYGASPKSIAMGQAFTGIADDFSAAYYNPAGLTQTKGVVEMSLGIFYAKQNATAFIEDVPFRADNDMPSEITGQRTTKGFIIGIASSLDVPSLVKAYPWFRRLAFGMVFWLNYPELLSYDVGPEPYRPHFFRYDEGFALLAMVASVAVEVTPWLSVGGGGLHEPEDLLATGSLLCLESRGHHSGMAGRRGLRVPAEYLVQGGDRHHSHPWIALQAACEIPSGQAFPRYKLAERKQVAPCQGPPDCQYRNRGPGRGTDRNRVARFREYDALQHRGVLATTMDGRYGRPAHERAFPGRGRDVERIF